jgi:Restriction endonuclease
MHTTPFLSDIPPPSNEQDFERMCVEIYREVYGCQQAQLFGRRGQRQAGIDILLRSPQGRIGVQAKRYKKLPGKIIEADIDAADASSLQLSLFLVATTAPSDSKLLEWIDGVSLFREEAGLFPIVIEFWDDIAQHIRQYPALKKFDVRPPAGSDDQERKHVKDAEALSSLFSAMNVDLLNQHLQNFPYNHRIDVAMMYDRFMEVYQNPGLYLHDRRLRKLFSDFSTAWSRAMPQDTKDFFEDTSMPGVLRFQSTGAQHRLLTFKKAPAAFKELQNAISSLSLCTRRLLDYVNESFSELDLKKLGQPLGQELRGTMRNLQRLAKHA